MNIVQSASPPSTRLSTAPVRHPNATFRETDYEKVWAGYSGQGGLSRLRDLVQQINRSTYIQSGNSCTSILRRAHRGQVIAFPLRTDLWLPNFQFVGDNFEILPGIAKALEEFQGTLNPLEIALWFCTPTVWLQNQSPMQVVAAAPDAVHAAARADRYIVSG